MDKRLIIICIMLLCSVNIKSQNAIVLESSNKPIIKVNIGDAEAYMLIDTGSSINILSIDAVNKYKLRVRTQYSGNVYSTNDNINAVHVDNVIIRVNGKPFYQYMMIDISVIVSNIKASTGIKIAGILGTPAIKELGMVIDLKRGIVTLND